MAEAVPRDYVLARWVYAELPSGRYSGPGVQKLTEKARKGAPFDELGEAERDLLVRKWQQVRGGESIFHAALDGITGFELTHWTREQVAAAYVIPMFAGEVGHAHSPVTFKQWITTEPNAPLDKGHARYAAENPGAPATTEDPVTASLVQIITVLGRVNTPEVKPFGLRGFMLLDGYRRAVRFWAKNDPAATLAVYVPTEV